MLWWTLSIPSWEWTASCKHQIPSLSEPLCIPWISSCYSELFLLVFCCFSRFISKLLPVFLPQCCLQCWCPGTRRFRPNSRPWMITATPSQRTLTSQQVSSPRATTFQVPCVFIQGAEGRVTEHRESWLGDPKLGISFPSFSGAAEWELCRNSWKLEMWALNRAVHGFV